MKISLIKPEKALSKAYFKQPILRAEMEIFKKELKTVFEQTDVRQNEEYHKNLIAKFLINTYYQNQFIVNVNKNQDLVIRLGDEKDDKVGVIMEFKNPNNQKEMLSVDNPNTKAFHELMLYYLRERKQGNNEIKYLIVSNLYEWFIFDEVWFHQHIFSNPKLQKAYDNFVLSGHQTQYFYDEIAKTYLSQIQEVIPCVYVNLKDYLPFLDSQNDQHLIGLYKILSPQYLLKQALMNDGNLLNEKFYHELLHILGLTQIKNGNKQLIVRNLAENRNEGSLLENTIAMLKTQRGLNENLDTEEQYFEIGLELCLTWLNRILFLKLLEGQLIQYHQNQNYAFLNSQKIVDFDMLHELFFEVLAEKEENRSSFLQKQFGFVPYLNSSLFEATTYENAYLRINQLKNRLLLPIFTETILKDEKGKKLKGNSQTLAYLFQFLDAYNFASSPNQIIQEDNKTLINASVLGLIFEKINGYKEGSFFTPSYITMYMCRQTLRQKVLQRFNETYHWNCQDFEALQDKIDYADQNERKKANQIINQLKICDLAVGSGHFLVSVLNELIVIKNELKILSLPNGKRLKGFQISLENDEIIITDQENDEFLTYRIYQNHKPIPEIQAIQEALFHEKQILIENCLFGVDINPKSVLICRLRLWIELLKNAYYTAESNYQKLETLPNLDINIKCGNSLISRFALNGKHFLLQKDKMRMAELVQKYKYLVIAYKNENNKTQKLQLQKQIQEVKLAFQHFTYSNDKDYLNWKKKKEELLQKQNEIPFAENYQNWQIQIGQLTKEVSDLEHIYHQKIQILYDNALEWRFEFPEILNDEGDFVGFDVIIGNPPYISIEDIEQDFRRFYESVYQTAVGRFDAYILFLEKSLQLKASSGSIALIIPTKFLNNKQLVKARKLLCKHHHLQILKIEDKVFAKAQVDSVIVHQYQNQTQNFVYQTFKMIDEKITLLTNISTHEILQDKECIFRLEVTEKFIQIIRKIEAQTLKLKEVAEVKDGIVAGVIKDVLYLNEPLDQDSQKLYFGKHLSKYHLKDTDIWVNYKPQEMMAEEKNRKSEKRTGLWLRDKNIFEREKILSRFVAKEIIATYDNQNRYYEHTLHSTYIFDKRLKTKYVLALFNSKLFKFYYQKTNSESGNIYPQVRIYSLENLPIKIITQTEQNFIEQIVNEILEKKSNFIDTSELETQLDQIIYQIYGIDADEQSIIEQS